MRTYIAAEVLGVSTPTLTALAAAGVIKKDVDGAYDGDSVRQAAALRDRPYAPAEEEGPIAALVPVNTAAGWDAKLALSEGNDLDLAMKHLGAPEPGEFLSGWWLIAREWEQRLVESHGALVGITGHYAHDAGWVMDSYRADTGRVAFRIRSLRDEERDGVLGFWPGSLRRVAYAALPPKEVEQS